MENQAIADQWSAGIKTVRMPSKRSVLIVGTFLSTSLSHRSMVEELAPRLSASGWSVLTTSDQMGRLRRPLDMIRTAWRQRRNYSLAQVDVYSGPAFIWAEAVCAALRVLGKPYILTLRGGSLPTFAARWPRRVRRLLGGAACVTTPSRYLLEKMKPFGSRLELLPNPLNVEDYDYRLRAFPRPNLIWLRAFRNIYNPALAPRVLALLAKKFSQVRLTMIGPDKKDGSLELTRLAATELRMGRRITLLDKGVPKVHVPAAMNEGDIFLNTTNVDNTPVSVLEAMACGLCVVSTNVGGIPYLLEHEQNALLVSPDDPAAMAEAVQRILTEPGLAERLSTNARWMTEQLDWSVILPKWERLLISAAAGGRGSAVTRVGSANSKS